MAKSTAVPNSKRAIDNSSSTSAALYPLLASVVLAYWLSIGVSIGESLRTIAVVALQIGFGSVIWQRFSGRRQTSACENIGMGFATGSLVLVAVRQTAIVFDSRLIELLLFSAIVGVLLPSIVYSWSIAREKKRTSFPRRPCFTRISQSDAIVAASVGVAVLGAREHVSSLRTLTTGILVLFVVFITRRPHAVTLEPRRLWLSSAVIVTVVTLPALLQSAAPWRGWGDRLIRTGSDDIIFSEALAYIIDVRGPFLDPSQSLALRYHWLSFAWTGATGRIANIEPLTMSGLLAPTIGYVVITALIVTALQTSVKSKLLPMAGAVSMFLLSSAGLRLTTIFVENTSNIFGQIWMLATVACYLLTDGRKLTCLSRRWVLLGIFTGATTLAKGPYGTVLVVIGGALLIIKSLQERRRPRAIEIGDAVAVVASFVAVYFGLISNSWGTGQVVVGLRSLVEAVPSAQLGVLVSILWILVRLAPILVELPESRQTNELRNIAIAAIPAIGAEFWINANGDTYFINAALAVIALGIAVRVCGLGQILTLKWGIHMSWSELLLSAVAVMFIGSPILSRLSPGRAVQCSLALGVVVLCWLGAHLVVHSQVNRQHRLQLIANVLVITSVVLGSFGRVSQVGELPQRAEFPTSTELRVMDKIREATTTDAVIATNFGFCRETNCSRNDYRRLFVPALAHREPSPLILNEVLTAGFPNQDSLSRILEFTDSPTTPRKNELLGMGATHFLLDATGASQTVMAQIGLTSRVIFSDQNFIFVELTK